MEEFVKFYCPGCKQHYAVKFEDGIGQEQMQCPNCKTTFVVGECLLSEDKKTNVADDGNLTMEIEKSAPGQAEEKNSGKTYAFKVGDAIGDYEILKPLGAVFWGEVYLVKHKMLQIQSVMRVFSIGNLQQSSSDEFLRRMQILYTIRHPNIVGITYFAQSQEKNFSSVFSEYVEGVTVSGYMKSNPCGMAISQALDIVQKISAALGEISAHGLIHNNIRPSNIFLTADHGVKLSDLESAGSNKSIPFASVAASNPEQLPPWESLAYYAPENGQNETVDIRADIYSLGMVLYFMLTGKLPFHSSTNVLLVGEMLYAETPAPGTIRKDIPAALDKFVLRMIAKKPENRQQTPEQLQQELTALQQELTEKKVESSQNSPKNGIPKFQLHIPSAAKSAPAVPPSKAVPPPAQKAAVPAQPPKAVPPSSSAPVQNSEPPQEKRKNVSAMETPILEDSEEIRGNEELLISEVNGEKYQKSPFSWKNLPAMLVFIVSSFCEQTKLSIKDFSVVIVLCICGGAAVAIGLSTDFAAVVCKDASSRDAISSFRAYKRLPDLTDKKQRKNCQKILAGDGDYDSICQIVREKRTEECIRNLCSSNEPDAYLIAATLKMLHLDRKSQKNDFLQLMEKAAELGSIEAASFLQVWHKCGGDPKKAEIYEKLCNTIIQEKQKRAEK